MRTLFRSAPALCCLLATALPAVAQMDAIWSCVDDQGHKVFQNNGLGMSCHRIDGVVATIPGTTSSPTPRRVAPPVSGVSPANFPRVDRDTQRLRDVDRRRILEDELRMEQDRLARLRSDFNNGNPRLLADETTASPSYHERTQRLVEDIQRSEGYIASLKREMAPVRY